MKEVIKKVIVENQKLNPEVKERNFKLPKTNKIITLSGPRRAGKSYLLFQIINQLEKENTLYINFDDERLDLTVENLDLIMEGYYELYPERQEQKNHVFLDEIQNIEGWERFVRRLYEKENIKLYITGSSSKMFSKELATQLRGRTLNFEVYPLDFKEYLKFKDIKLERNYEYTNQRYKIKNEFKEYMEYGGFPEILDEELKVKVLQSYLDLMTYKDIIERYNIRNTKLLKNLIKYLLKNHSKEFSIKKYHNQLKDLKVSKDTIYEYLGYLEETNLVYLLPRQSYSLKKQQYHNHKVYSVDTGFINANAYKFSEEKGRLLENVVFVELKRREKEIYYYKGKGGCDFVVKEGLDVIEAVQVCYELNEENQEREVKGLVEAMNEYGLEEGLILTNDEERVIEEKGKKIIVKPTWKWLLK